jgi:hypothetical protein
MALVALIARTELVLGFPLKAAALVMSLFIRMVRRYRPQHRWEHTPTTSELTNLKRVRFVSILSF